MKNRWNSLMKVALLIIAVVLVYDFVTTFVLAWTSVTNLFWMIVARAVAVFMFIVGAFVAHRRKQLTGNMALRLSGAALIYLGAMVLTSFEPVRYIWVTSMIFAGIGLVMVVFSIPSKDEKVNI